MKLYNLYIINSSNLATWVISYPPCHSLDR